MRRQPTILVVVAMLTLSGVAQTSADSVTIVADRDNTLYESNSGTISNGSGRHFFAGSNANGATRRGLLRFDIAANVPSGATITSVQLNLNMSRTRVATGQTIRLHRVLADWGEAGSVGIGNEGSGASAQTGDATWLHRFFSTTPWGNPGGDFVATPSAQQSVAGLGSYVWGSTVTMQSDVQAWLDNPASNFGWILLGNEFSAATSKRFDSRENLSAANWPQLVVEFTPTVAVDDGTWSKLKALFR